MTMIDIVYRINIEILRCFRPYSKSFNLGRITKKYKNDWFNWRIIPSRSSVRAGATVQSHSAFDFPEFP